jgi:hypothetical protein
MFYKKYVLQNWHNHGENCQPEFRNVKACIETKCHNRHGAEMTTLVFTF